MYDAIVVDPEDKWLLEQLDQISGETQGFMTVTRSYLRKEGESNEEFRNRIKADLAEDAVNKAIMEDDSGEEGLSSRQRGDERKDQANDREALQRSTPAVHDRGRYLEEAMEKTPPGKPGLASWVRWLRVRSR